MLSDGFMEPLQYGRAVSSSSLFSNIFPSIAEILNLILIHWDFRLPQPIETRNIDSFKTLKISDQFYKYSFQGIEKERIKHAISTLEWKLSLKLSKMILTLIPPNEASYTRRRVWLKGTRQLPSR